MDARLHQRLEDLIEEFGRWKVLNGLIEFIWPAVKEREGKEEPPDGQQDSG